jgi:hypothetical protein
VPRKFHMIPGIVGLGSDAELPLRYIRNALSSKFYLVHSLLQAYENEGKES